ncbi:ABC transporter permease subunit [Shouchella clausii]|uniref:ABC transporter permease n=1 Tax=Shouchella TaxID=2893057 RepID=UPI0004E792A5|nr:MULTISPECIES: ABC transporter permease subunit [Shouchella]ALA54003.1 ABC transporter, permease protein [Shouchella clausii]MBU3229443.1 ABC transporter permease subunit [Shouchella clausii]MBU3265334.1 ABC transporter permease subunit [Shouchella clausii]MBU3506344.1 ABC transporter permease subunit [Shouchella clausii]MBU3535130.1 ABC transporter permease subunit [Shouchella clausii]
MSVVQPSRIKGNRARLGHIQPQKQKKFVRVLRSWQLYVLLAPTIIYFLIFKYYPMYGLQIAFKNYLPSLGVWGSEWVGLDHFMRFFQSYQFWTILENTLVLSIYELAVGFPLPILLALMLNMLISHKYKRFLQTVVYAPHFISVVVLVGILFVFLSPSSGLINHLIRLFGGEPINFMASPEWFKTLYVFSGVWQGTGFAAIIYLAALSGVDPSLHEAAVMDGASKFKRMLHIDIPAIMPISVIMLILALGNLMNIGFEKALLMQTPLNKESSNIIATYVYEVGIQQAQYSFGTAVGLFNAIINLILLVTVNQIARKMSDSSLW